MKQVDNNATSHAMSKSRTFVLAAVVLLIGGSLGAFVTHQIHVAGIKSKGSIESPVELPKDALTKIEGKAAFSGKTIQGEFYNGTDWTLTDVDVIVTKKKTWDTRRFRVEIWDAKFEWQKDARSSNATQTKVTLKPYGVSDFKGETGDFLDGVESKDDKSWSIESARGFKQ